jgi:hypothetical protein
MVRARELSLALSACAHRSRKGNTPQKMGLCRMDLVSLAAGT